MPHHTHGPPPASTHNLSPPHATAPEPPSPPNCYEGICIVNDRKKALKLVAQALPRLVLFLADCSPLCCIILHTSLNVCNGVKRRMTMSIKRVLYSFTHTKRFWITVSFGTYSTSASHHPSLKRRARSQSTACSWSPT